MSVRNAADATRLLASAHAAREASQELWREALAAQWRASGTRLVHQDFQLEVAWTLYQQRRRRDGLHGYFRKFREIRRPG